MSEHSPDAAVDPLDEELIAYLDGELDEAARRAVEERLGSEQAYRLRLQSLERAWDMLDLLPPAEASENFTRTTVEMTIETAADQAQTQQLQTRRAHRYSLALGIAGAFLACVVGYLAVVARLDSPNRQLVRDLPVIERVDEYRNVESLDFLQRLAEEGLFTEPEEEAADAY